MPASLAPRLAPRLAWSPLLVAGLVAFVVASVGGALTEIGPWYRGLAKPSFQPPDWLFAPAWTLIYALAAWSAATAWRDAPDATAQRFVVVLYSANAVLNALWSALFFALRNPGAALVEAALLWLSVLAPMLFVRRFSPRAAWLLAPYLAWVSFATALNLAIVHLN